MELSKIARFIQDNFEPYSGATQQELVSLLEEYTKKDLIALCVDSNDNIQSLGMARKLKYVDHDDVYANKLKHIESGKICVVELLICKRGADMEFLIDQLFSRLEPFDKVVFVRQLVDNGKKIRTIPRDFLVKHKQLFLNTIGDK
jgi:hypothetical protein